MPVRDTLTANSLEELGEMVFYHVHNSKCSIIGDVRIEFAVDTYVYEQDVMRYDG